MPTLGSVAEPRCAGDGWPSPAAIPLEAAALAALRVPIFAMRRTRRLRRRGSWLLLRQLSTARWMRPRLPRRGGFNWARAQPTVLHSLSYCRRLPRYCSRGQHARGYTQLSCLNSGDRSSVWTDSTSQRIVYSILTRSREYSKAIH